MSESRVARSARLYQEARLGDLHFGEVLDSQDAEWARNGLRDGVAYGNLAHHRRWAEAFLANLDADFG